ncbi:MAG: ribosomal RNA small subunit methyltransferase A [Methyloligella sp.]|nr:MAG: ribosomal RNA small subunit methyltransferase A [Methyloligella sp.]
MNDMALDDLPALKDILHEHELRAKKSLGQNFLLDLNITRKIARLANARAGTSFVEVGPGPGGLTRGLLMEGVDRLLVIERDVRVLPILKEIAAHSPGTVSVEIGDALKVDWAAENLGFSLEENLSGPIELVSNLPYNIGTVLLTNWLEMDWPLPIACMTLMFQEEVAERIVAKPGSKAYGRLSVLANWRCDTEIVYRLPRDAFTPPPKISSAIVQLRPKETLEYTPSPLMFRQVTAAAFGQRRKMLRASLKSLSKDIVSILTELEIDPTARAETLQWQDYCRLAMALEDLS